ncbi:family 16 glycosylhydrolase [Aureimonas sp. AU40]|uniref:family 16 glycosylhydrolase n=1 Tax=Aureimonas sp. AU40 TaxID=1637747 RepID=UPI0007848018|nr:family 16 glycosylhydrolase [Aureimonas sp. AU40]
MKDLSNYQLTFSDEFNTRSISQNGAGTVWADIRPEWRFDAQSDIGFGRSSFVDPGSGYDPFKVENGILTITAVPDRTPFGMSGSWESGLIHTRGSFQQTYGYFEMRADLSETKGAWDAFWLLPTKQINEGKNGGWQELNVVEHYGNNPTGVYSWLHTTDYHADRSAELQVYSEHANQTQGFHTYGMDWNKDTISFYYDGQLIGTKATPSDMHGPMFILANLAVEANADPSGPAPQTQIDYIRAYAEKPASVEPPAYHEGAVYRFFNKDNGMHFFTSSAAERDAVIKTLPQYRFEGEAFDGAGAGAAGTIDVFRFFNKTTGAHFYTANVAERDQVIRTLANFDYEGVAYKAYASGENGAHEELYRFYNKQTDAHFYTANEAERDAIIHTLPSYSYEGVAYYVDFA